MAFSRQSLYIRFRCHDIGTIPQVCSGWPVIKEFACEIHPKFRAIEVRNHFVLPIFTELNVELFLEQPLSLMNGDINIQDWAMIRPLFRRYVFFSAASRIVRGIFQFRLFGILLLCSGQQIFSLHSIAFCRSGKSFFLSGGTSSFVPVRPQ